MPIKHTKLNETVLVTFINRPVSKEHVLAEIESLARFAHEKMEWHHIVVLGDNTLSSLEYVDVITLSEWLRGVYELFSHSWIALCSDAENDFKMALDLANLLACENTTVAVFRELHEAREWELFACRTRSVAI